MDIIKRVNAICEEQLDSLAKQVKREMVAVCNEHRKTGAAANSVFIEKTGEKTRFVGAPARRSDGRMTSFFYLDQGNGGKNAVITSNGDYPMRFKGYKGAYAGKWYTKWAVSGYNGIHFVRDIAEKHGGG